MNTKGVRLITNTMPNPPQATQVLVTVGWDGSIDCQGYDLTDEQRANILGHAKKFMLSQKALSNVFLANKEFWDGVEIN